MTSEIIKEINNNVLELIKLANSISGQVYSDEYYSERIFLKKANNLTDFQEPVINPYVKSLLQFKTIENLYKPEIRLSPKVESSYVDMREVMSKPFCIENLYYAKHETVDEATLDEFNQNTGNDVKKADLYITDNSWEDLRMHVLAFAFAVKIIMMRGQHKPETEEGRKLLAHELTHVAQNQNKEFVDHRTREELEEEAEANERTAESIQDPLITRNLDGEDIVLPASRWHNVSQYVFRHLPEWLHYQKFILPPKEYELLKKKYEYWMKYKSYKYRW